jgi:outer membrane lipoprotein-sorting protein
VLFFPAGGEDESSVTVWVSREMDFPIKSEENLPNGDINHYLLSNVRLNAPIDDSIFNFEVPEDVEIIDMTE